MKTFFNRVDFADLNFEPELTQDELQHLADVANAKLEQWLAKAIKVTGYIDDEYNFGSATSEGLDTHRALLIDIQELPTKPCKHEPAIKLIKENGIEVSLEGPCRRCGVPLKAKWEEA